MKSGPVPVETAFDPHRFDLLNALHVPLPPDQKHELETNATVTEFLRRDFRVSSDTTTTRTAQ